jgi:hypothetical protein
VRLLLQTPKGLLCESTFKFTRLAPACSSGLACDVRLRPSGLPRVTLMGAARIPRLRRFVVFCVARDRICHWNSPKATGSRGERNCKKVGKKFPAPVFDPHELVAREHSAVIFDPFSALARESMGTGSCPLAPSRTACASHSDGC